MEAFERIKKIGKGNFGDVLLVKRKSDDQVS
jgi:NIMA (never in mitosis gene a)-related kinase